MVSPPLHIGVEGEREEWAWGGMDERSEDRGWGTYLAWLEEVLSGCALGLG